MNRPTCPSCGTELRAAGPMCGPCWGAVPAWRKKRVNAAWKRYLARPGSKQLMADYDVAVAEAVEAIP